VPKPKKKEGNKHQKHQETTHKKETIPFFQKEAPHHITPHLPETIRRRTQFIFLFSFLFLVCSSGSFLNEYTVLVFILPHVDNSLLTEHFSGFAHGCFAF